MKHFFFSIIAICLIITMSSCSDSSYAGSIDTNDDTAQLEVGLNLRYVMSKATQIAKLNIAYDISYANASEPISLNNYLDNNQNVHPKVLYFENGFGGHSYWMAYTPYPYSKDIHENPCIAYSDDGYIWTNIEGNPLDNPKGNGYNSDTHLVYREDTSTLECWYRYVGDTSQPVREETIYRQTSTDGITWSEKEFVYSNMDGTFVRLLSPAIVWDGEKYNIWVVNLRTINYYTASSSDVTNWNFIRELPLSFIDGDLQLNPWHLDVIKDGDTYIMLVMCRKNKELGNPMSLFITTSQDNTTYEIPYKVLGGSDGWDRYIYRSSIVKVGEDYRIYYSATNGGSKTVYSPGAVWGIGITQSRKSLNRFIGSKGDMILDTDN